MAETLSAGEKAALKELAAERRNQAKREKLENIAQAELADCLAKIAEMTQQDQALATSIHELLAKKFPMLTAKTWYGMPAYQLDGNTVCFFQCASKFKTRYSSLGFQESAKLDEGEFWPIVYAITGFSKATEKHITELVERAIA